jgi:eukaryotic-like serine/threonine-protein kinase
MRTATPHLDDDIAVAWIEGRVGGAMRAQTEAHLDVCLDCRLWIGELGKLAAVDPDGPSLGPGSRLGRYEIEALIGSGTMGVVLRARDVELGRRVALKLLRDPEAASFESEARFRREARALARLSHPNVVAIFDVGRIEGRLFFAMELVEGPTLGRWIRAPGRTHAEIIGAFIQAARGLAAAHSAGVVHRDFKPDNVLIGPDGRVRVTDFGLSRFEAERDPEGQPDPSLSGAGCVVGTPAYMAPEQLCGARGDARSDQFSFAVALWEALFGKRPFIAPTIEAIERGVEIPLVTGVPRPIRRALSRALDADPTARFESMEAVIAALSNEASKRNRIFIPAAVMAAVALGALLATSWLGVSS